MSVQKFLRKLKLNYVRFGKRLTRIAGGWAGAEPNMGIPWLIVGKSIEKPKKGCGGTPNASGRGYAAKGSQGPFFWCLDY